MARFTGVLLLFFAASSGLVLAGDSDLKSEEVYQAWLQMYDLKFDQAHEILKQLAGNASARSSRSSIRRRRVFVFRVGPAWSARIPAFR